MIKKIAGYILGGIVVVMVLVPYRHDADGAGSGHFNPGLGKTLESGPSACRLSGYMERWSR